jgi:hypothetical protein
LKTAKLALLIGSLRHDTFWTDVLPLKAKEVEDSVFCIVVTTLLNRSWIDGMGLFIKCNVPANRLLASHGRRCELFPTTMANLRAIFRHQVEDR